jgi:hypothetical protein
VREQAEERKAKAIALSLLQSGMSAEEVSVHSTLSIDVVRDLS